MADPVLQLAIRVDRGRLGPSVPRADRLREVEAVGVRLAVERVAAVFVDRVATRVVRPRNREFVQRDVADVVAEIPHPVES